MRPPRLDARTRRLVLPAVVALLLLGPPASVRAHAELVSASPAAGAVLTTAPAEVTLVFDAELDPESSAFSVTAASGSLVGEGEVDLTVAGRNELSGSVTIVEPGRYTVAWNAASIDGHSEPGELAFEYAPPAPGRPAPDTATVSDEDGIGSGISAAGVLALVAALVATVLAGRRADS